MATRIELFKTAEGVEYKTGAIIFNEGDERDNLYIVQSGKIEIEDTQGHIRTVGEGEIFGEMALITHSKRAATARVLEDAKLVPISAKRFLFLIDNNRDFALAIMKVLCERLVEPREGMTGAGDG